MGSEMCIRDRHWTEAAALGEACRLAMLLLLAPIWRRYEITHSYTIILIRKQAQIMHKLSHVSQHAPEPWLSDLLLWVLCISTIEAIAWAASANLEDGRQEAHLLVQRLVSAPRRIAASAGVPLRGKENIEAVLKRVSWVDSVLDHGVVHLASLLQHEKPITPPPL